MAEIDKIAGEELNKLRSVYRDLDQWYLSRWNRSIPFGDALRDRWERAQDLGFADGVSIYDSSFVFGDVVVGENTWIGPFTILDGTGGLNIGSYCSVAAGVHIYSHDSVAWAISGGTAPYKKASVEIGDRCYIGPNAVIAKGVTVGSGSIIAANSVLTIDVPSAYMAAGNPAELKAEISLETDGTITKNKIR